MQLSNTINQQVFDDAGYKSQIEEAVENGAKIIVCPGFKLL